MIILSTLGIILVGYLGYLIIDTLLRETHILEKMSLGFLTGFGLFTFIAFLANLVGVPYSLKGMGSELAGLIILAFIAKLLLKRRESKDKIFLNEFKKITTSEKVIGGLIVTILGLSFITSIQLPTGGWDAIVLYDFRAITFVKTGFMWDVISRGYWNAYPLFTSIAHTWIYLVGLQSPMFFYSLLLVSFIISFYFALRRFASRNLSLLLCLIMLLVSALYENITIAYTDMPYTIFISLSAIFIYLWSKEKKWEYLIISALMTGFSTWIRAQEPFWMINFLLIIVFSFKDLKRLFQYIIVYGLISYPFQYVWKSFTLHADALKGDATPLSTVTSSASFLFSSQIPGLIIPVVKFFYTNAIAPYLLLYIVALIVIINKILRKNWKIDFTVIFLLELGLFFLSSLIFASLWSGWEGIPGSLKRLSLFIQPMIIFLIAESLSKYENRH